MTASFRFKRVGTVALPGLDGERRAVLGKYVLAAAILQDGLPLNDLEVFILARMEVKRGLLLEELLAFDKIQGNMKSKVSIWMVDHPRGHGPIETLMIIQVRRWEALKPAGLRMFNPSEDDNSHSDDLVRVRIFHDSCHQIKSSSKRRATYRDQTGWVNLISWNEK